MKIDKRYMKFLTALMFVVSLTSANAQAQETRRLRTVNTPCVRFRSATATFDNEKQTFAITLLFRNTGRKPISKIIFKLALHGSQMRESEVQAFEWKLYWTAPLPVGKEARDVTDNRTVFPEQARNLLTLLETPNARIGISQVIFADGTIWGDSVHERRNPTSACS